jgi:hypothetical protein
MAKRTRTTAKRGDAPEAAQGMPIIVHSSLYLPGPVHEALREILGEPRLPLSISGSTPAGAGVEAS